MRRSTKKEKILLCALKFVISKGWSEEAFKQAAKESCGDESFFFLEFPNGLAQATSSLNAYFDAQMSIKYKDSETEGMRIHERIALLLTLRFELMDPYHEAGKALLRYLLHPARLPLAVKLSQKTVSTMWYLAGDQATDFNYYSKRFLLGYVYNTTFIHWARTRKDSLSAAKNFALRRLKDVSYIPKVKNTIKKWGQNIRNLIPHPFQKS